MAWEGTGELEGRVQVRAILAWGGRRTHGRRTHGCTYFDIEDLLVAHQMHRLDIAHEGAFCKVFQLHICSQQGLDFPLYTPQFLRVGSAKETLLDKMK